ncbi:MAG: phosphatidate cytidylyltransferase, partial [Flavobacteriales bacterium]
MSAPAKNDLLQRSITGALFVLVVTGCIYWCREAAIILFAVFNAIAIYEYLHLTAKISGKTEVNYVMFALLLLPYNLFGLSVFVELENEIFYILAFIPLLIMANGLFSREKEKSFLSIGLDMGALTFVVLPFALVIPFTFSLFAEYDWKILFSLITLVWANDTMAYVTGKLIGRNKLAPGISPGKTVEGFIGGVLFAGGMGALWAYVMNADYISWILVGIVVGIAATVGDLAESLLKRTAGVKDSGTIFPG